MHTYVDVAEIARPFRAILTASAATAATAAAASAAPLRCSPDRLGRHRLPSTSSFDRWFERVLADALVVRLCHVSSRPVQPVPTLKCPAYSAGKAPESGRCWLSSSGEPETRRAVSRLLYCTDKGIPRSNPEVPTCCRTIAVNKKEKR